MSRLLARRGAVVIDADAIVHELQQAGEPLLDTLAERFGGEIIRDDGSLDRAKLATIAFARFVLVRNKTHEDLQGQVKKKT